MTVVYDTLLGLLRIVGVALLLTVTGLFILGAGLNVWDDFRRDRR